jgi:hypothetical protein
MYGRKEPEMNRIQKRRTRRLSQCEGIRNYGGEKVPFAPIMKALQV